MVSVLKCHSQHTQVITGSYECQLQKFYYDAFA